MTDNNKRQSEGNEQNPKKVRLPDAPPLGQVQLMTRILVDTKCVGGLIGRGGSTIKELREQSLCQIDIADAVPGASKRIIAVHASSDCVAMALHLIADKLAANRTTEGNESTPESRLIMIIPNSQIGALIGKSGARINQTRQDSGANIKVSETLEHSTEKSVTVRGTSEQVFTALALLCHQLEEAADKHATIPYWPQPDNSYAQLADHGQRGQLGAAGAAYEASLGLRPSYGYGAVSFAGQRGPEQSVVIPVPESLIGYVIGRKGATIEDIRQRSKANLKVSEKSPDLSERSLTITGAQEAVEVAVAMVNEKLSQYDLVPAPSVRY